MTTDRTDDVSDVDEALIDEALEWRALMDDEIVDNEKRAAFQAWVMSDPSHMQAFDYAERLWDQLKLVSDPSDRQSELSTPVPQITLSQPRRPITLIGAFVVLVVVILAATTALRPATTLTGDAPTAASYRTDIAEFRSIELAEGSRIVLGPDSAVEIRMDDARRAVVLTKGDAFFDVVKNVSRPFSVVAGNAHVSVVGTQFDVRRATETTRIAVADGRVEVEVVNEAPGKRGGRPLTLQPGQTVTLDSGSLGEISSMSTELVGAWRENRLAFFNEPLSRVVEQVNRYDRREIVLENVDLAALTISATLDASDVDALLQTLAEIYPVVVSQPDAQRVVITQKK
ncbi:MAG: FecR domain-containing protein [Pseudomonadota bacterium]